MPKFNLAKAKTGAIIKTRNGDTAKILLFDRDNKRFPIVAIVNNKYVHYYTNAGKYYDNGKQSILDLLLS